MAERSAPLYECVRVGLLSDEALARRFDGLQRRVARHAAERREQRKVITEFVRREWERPS